MSLERILESEVMDSELEAEAYNDLDHSEVNRCFVADLLAFAHSVDHQIQDVLDVGTGTALIPIELCRELATCRIMAIDEAVSMLDLARYNLAATEFTERVKLAKVDAKQMIYEDGMFDAVIANSFLHHLSEPLACLKEMLRVADDESILFVRDLMRPEDMETLESLVETYAGREPEFSQKSFRESLHAALSLGEIQAMVGELGFDPATVAVTSDRHWTWTGIKSVEPEG